jgi:hypothetical protein
LDEPGEQWRDLRRRDLHADRRATCDAPAAEEGLVATAGEAPDRHDEIEWRGRGVGERLTVDVAEHSRCRRCA